MGQCSSVGALVSAGEQMTESRQHRETLRRLHRAWCGSNITTRPAETAALAYALRVLEERAKQVVALQAGGGMKWISVARAAAEYLRDIANYLDAHGDSAEPLLVDAGDAQRLREIATLLLPRRRLTQMRANRTL